MQTPRAFIAALVLVFLSVGATESRAAVVRQAELGELVSASSTTVSRRIKELEAHGLVVRSMNPAMPQSNLYSLSSDGEQLSPVMQSLYDWAENWTIPA